MKCGERIWGRTKTGGWLIILGTGGGGVIVGFGKGKSILMLLVGTHSTENTVFRRFLWLVQIDEQHVRDACVTVTGDSDRKHKHSRCRAAFVATRVLLNRQEPCVCFLIMEGFMRGRSEDHVDKGWIIGQVDKRAGCLR